VHDHDEAEEHRIDVQQTGGVFTEDHREVQVTIADLGQDHDQESGEAKGGEDH